MIEFCKNCNNMLYLKVNNYTEEDQNIQLIKYCKNCTYSITSDDQHHIINKQFDVQNNFHHLINPNIINDHTLPRASNIDCKNPDCKKTNKTTNEIIYIKYDAVNMKYLYHCCNCSLFWVDGYLCYDYVKK